MKINHIYRLTNVQKYLESIRPLVIEMAKETEGSTHNEVLLHCLDEGIDSCKFGIWYYEDGGDDAK